MIDKIVGFGLNILSDGLDRVGSESSEEEKKMKRTKKFALRARTTLVFLWIVFAARSCVPSSILCF